MAGSVAMVEEKPLTDVIAKGWAPFEQQEARSRGLRQTVPDALIYVGLCGVTLESSSVNLVPGLITLRKVVNPPDVIHVTCAANTERSDWLGVGRHARNIAAELCVHDAVDQLQIQGALDFAFHAVALLKLHGVGLVHCPVASSASFDLICDIADHSVDFRLLDDVGGVLPLSAEGGVVGSKATTWVKKHFATALELRNTASSRRFGLAFNLAYRWNHTRDPRVALTSLWNGLEALFGRQEDEHPAEALCDRVAEWVRRSPMQVRALYKRRCDAVQGQAITDAVLFRSVESTEAILRAALRRCIERHERTLPDRI